MCSKIILVVIHIPISSFVVFDVQLMAEVDSMFGTPITTPSYAKKQYRDSLSLTPTPTRPAASASTFEIFNDSMAAPSSMSASMPVLQVLVYFCFLGLKQPVYIDFFPTTGAR